MSNSALAAAPCRCDTPLVGSEDGVPYCRRCGHHVEEQGHAVDPASLPSSPSPPTVTGAELLTEMRALRSEVAALRGELDRRSLVAASAPTPEPEPDDEFKLLDTKQAAALLGKTEDWCGRNRELLGAIPLPSVRGTGKRPRWGYTRAGLRRYLEGNSQAPAESKPAPVVARTAATSSGRRRAAPADQGAAVSGEADAISCERASCTCLAEGRCFLCRRWGILAEQLIATPCPEHPALAWCVACGGRGAVTYHCVDCEAWRCR